MHVKIEAIAGCIPERSVTSSEVEQTLRTHNPELPVPSGIIESLTEIHSRQYVDDEDASDLASRAASIALEKSGLTPADIDLLIFASASQDLVEPATSHIVQSKLGTQCQVFDLKNACNSFLNAIQVAEAMIRAGSHRRVLVATGETCSKTIRWKLDSSRDFRDYFIGYTLGDAGAAAILAASDEAGGINYHANRTLSKHWRLVTVPGGGSRHPRGDEYSYVRGDPVGLRNSFRELGPELLHEVLEATHTSIEDYKRVLMHQVSMPALRNVLDATGIPESKVELTLPYLGNIASATLPMGFAQAERAGRIKRGDLLLWIGLASGISASIMALTY